MAKRPDKKTNDRPKDRPIQPYVDWAIQTRFGYLRDGDWLPLLVEFDPDALVTQNGEMPYDAFARLDWLGAPDSLKDAVRIPKLLQELPEPLKKEKDFRFCVVLVRRGIVCRSFRTRLVEAHNSHRGSRASDGGRPLGGNRSEHGNCTGQACRNRDHRQRHRLCPRALPEFRRHAHRISLAAGIPETGPRKSRSFAHRSMPR